MTVLQNLRKELRKIANPQKAKILQRFFKTGKGEYGEGDKLLGITVPQSRKIAKKYSSLDIKELGELIKSKYHEERLIALFILINKYNTTNHKKIIFHFYIKNVKQINNWDLVDLSAGKIVGRYLFNSLGSTRSLNISENSDKLRKPEFQNFRKSDTSELPTIRQPESSEFSDRILFSLAISKSIWERRIAVLATFYFIKNNQFDESLKIAEMLLHDQHDLIHKAVGWMLREVGKRDVEAEINFLDKHYGKMPRTMLRYAIERFPEKKRSYYLK